MKETLGVLSGVLFFSGFIPYIVAILRKQTRPAKASWVIWAALDAITLAGMIAAGTDNIQIWSVVAGAWIIMLLSLKYGSPGWTALDKICLAGAFIGVSLWWIFSSPLLGILMSLTSIFLGSIPTFVSAWENPKRENKLAWTIFFTSCVCGVLAIPKWTWGEAAQPLVFFLINAIMMYILFVQPCFRAREEIHMMLSEEQHPRSS